MKNLRKKLYAFLGAMAVGGSRLVAQATTMPSMPSTTTYTTTSKYEAWYTPDEYNCNSCQASCGSASSRLEAGIGAAGLLVDSVKFVFDPNVPFLVKVVVVPVVGVPICCGFLYAINGNLDSYMGKEISDKFNGGNCCDFAARTKGGQMVKVKYVQITTTTTQNQVGDHGTNSYILAPWNQQYEEVRNLYRNKETYDKVAKQYSVNVPLQPGENWENDLPTEDEINGQLQQNNVFPAYQPQQSGFPAYQPQQSEFPAYHQPQQVWGNNGVPAPMCGGGYPAL